MILSGGNTSITLRLEKKNQKSQYNAATRNDKSETRVYNATTSLID